jgi:hypothetical protein
MVSIAKLHSLQPVREQFFWRRPLPISSPGLHLFRPSVNNRLVSQPGAGSPLHLAVCPSAACSPTSGAKVPHALALLAARPSAATVRFCAVASHRTSSLRSRLRRHRLACSAGSAKVAKPSDGAYIQNTQEARWLNANQAKATRPFQHLPSA